jgi:hypothetical protein
MITNALDRFGVPYDKVVASQTPLTATMLSDVAGHGRYYAIVLTTGNLSYFNSTTQTWQSALTWDQWVMLRNYQAQFGVRSVTSYTFPEATYGMSYVGYQDTLSSPLQGGLTAAGQQVFSQLNPTAAIPFTGAWLYLGTITDPNVTTPLITTTVNGTTYPIASVTKYADGHENLAITVANNAYLVHSLALTYGWVNWVTKGAFLGNRHTNIDIQIDDLFIEDDMWNPATHTTGSTVYRNTPQDITTLVNWQNSRRAKPTTPNLQVEFAFNGVGTTGGYYNNVGEFSPNAQVDPATDTLLPAVQANKAQFGFINHTYDHFNLDCGTCPNPTGTITTTAAQVKKEITDNIQTGQALGFSSDWDTMVQPDISGINTPPNPTAQKAAADVGIRYWIGDTSRAGQNNPTFNTGFYTAGDPRLFVVPRRPTNLFVPASTPAQWVDIYNYFYAPGGALCGSTTCYTAPQTYQQILDHESTYLLQYLLQGDLNPLMFHTPNVRAYDGVHSLLSDLFDLTFSKYDALMKAPVRNLPFKQAGLAQQARGLYNASGVTASLTPCSSITLKATNAAVVPLTGVSYSAANSSVETYAGQAISNISLTAGQTVTVPITC